jgi:hypothetical protein
LPLLGLREVLPGKLMLNAGACMQMDGRQQGVRYCRGPGAGWRHVCCRMLLTCCSSCGPLLPTQSRACSSCVYKHVHTLVWAVRVCAAAPPVQQTMWRHSL